MDNNLVSLVAANIAFVGAHFVLSHPLRAPLVKAMGEKGFMGLYSLLNLAIFAWIILAFLAVGPGGAMLWNGQADVPWVVASLLSVVALVLLFGSFKGNPAMPQVTPEAVAQARVAGIFAVTRHPMMWGTAIWALAHILVAPNGRTIATAGGMAVLALFGAHLQDRKKEVLLGAAWKGWEAKTSFVPRLGALGGIGWGLWLAALVGWLAFTWAHKPLAGMPAGLWRWLG